MHWSSIGLGLVIGIPLWALTYRWTKRATKRGYRVSDGGDYSSGGGHHGGDSGGGDAGSH
jgi:uncharacterized membrane-anchored protein YhcB (DUF1043 family)